MLLFGCVSPGPIQHLSDADAVGILPAHNDEFSLALAHFGQGVVHELHQERAPAIAQYLKAIEHEPEYEELYILTARRLVQEDRDDEAIALIRKLMLRRSNSPRPYLWMASVHQKAGNFEQAEQNYRKAILVDPTQIDNYTKLCLLLYEREEYEKAITLLEQGLDKVTQPLKGYDYLGSLYRKMAESELDALRSQTFQRRAIAMYREALEKFPGHTSFYRHLGSLLARQGDVVEAIANFAELEKFSPDNHKTKRIIAEALSANLGGNAAAINKLQRYIELHPGDAFVQYYLGCLFEEAKETRLAVDAFQKSAALEPAESSPYFKVANLSMTNQVEMAEAMLQEGRSKLPGNSLILESLAYNLMQQKKYQESLEYFDEVQKLLNRQGVNTNTENFHYHYSVAAQQSTKLEMSAYQLYRAAQLNPQRLYRFLQQLLRQEGEGVLEEGITILSEVARRMPREPSLQVYLGLLHNYNEDYEGALRNFKKVVKLAEDLDESERLLNAQFYFTFAAATERAGDFAESERLFKICLAKDENHIEACNYLAYMWAEKGLKLDEAEALIDRALKAEPKNAAFLDTKGWIFFMQGRYEEARGLLSRAARLEEDPTITDHLGDALSKLGQHQEARAEWEKALAMKPDEKLRTAVERKIEEADRELKRLKEEAEQRAAKAEPGLEPGPEGKPDPDPENKTGPAAGKAVADPGPGPDAEAVPENLPAPETPEPLAVPDPAPQKDPAPGG